MINGAQRMVESLLAEGVTTIFGYPGAAICPFYDKLYGSAMRHILVRQEQNAAHAASGWARISGRPGVCVATSGPGALNLITGIATAYMDSIPLVAITGQIDRSELGRDVFQEADITGACESVTKHSILLTDARDIPRAFKEAFLVAGTGRPGPVLIDVPIDVQLSESDEPFVYPETVDIPGYHPTTKGHPLQIKRALSAIGESLRPILCCGGGVLLGNAREAFLKFARKGGLPVVSTMMGLGVMPSNDPLFLGMIGSHGEECANRAFREADLLVLCGARVGDRAVAAPNQIADQAKIIHIDVDPAEIGKNMRADIPIVGELRGVLEKMTEKLEPVERAGWRTRVEGYRNARALRGEDREDFVEPRSFLRKLSEQLPANTVLTADPGQGQIWAARNFAIHGGRFLTSGGLGTMGYALPAALGAAVAAPERTVVAVCGDGAFQMSMCELATLCQTHAPVKVILFDNRRLGMVRELQNQRYGGRHYATYLSGNPDFLRLCAAYGIPARFAATNAEADAFAGEMLAARGPFVLICRVDPDTPTL